MAPGIATSPRPGTPGKINLNSDGPNPQKFTLNLKYHLKPHNEVTTDFDELKFHAAASRQINWGHHEESESSSSTSAGVSASAGGNTTSTPVLSDTATSGTEQAGSGPSLDTRLIASPYNDVPHLLDLETLDIQSRLLALALASFRSVRDDYATAAYLDNFNWDEVFGLVRSFAEIEGHKWTAQTFYVVAFRSILLPGVDNDHLHALDAYSHQEAVASGGLLKYWFGTKDEERRNLATCIWRSREDARLGGRGPWHAKARLAARELYENITFTTMKLFIEDDVASWSIGDWESS